MCGIVGLFLKDPKLEPQLGALLNDMLITMTDRGRWRLHAGDPARRSLTAHRQPAPLRPAPARAAPVRPAPACAGACRYVRAIGASSCGIRRPPQVPRSDITRQETCRATYFADGNAHATCCQGSFSDEGAADFC